MSVDFSDFFDNKFQSEDEPSEGAFVEGESTNCDGFISNERRIQAARSVINERPERNEGARSSHLSTLFRPLVES